MAGKLPIAPRFEAYAERAGYRIKGPGNPTKTTVSGVPVDIYRFRVHGFDATIEVYGGDQTVIYTGPVPLRPRVLDFLNRLLGLDFDVEPKMTFFRKRLVARKTLGRSWKREDNYADEVPFP
ncbi:MAG TPA: hypothetical protein VJB06_04830 [archaeon]|nr:hypothetical protein [archaeon]